MPRPLFAVPLLCLAAAVLSGCQSVETTQQTSGLRVVDASMNAPAVNLLVGQNTLFANVSAPSFSGYAPIGLGDSILTLRNSTLTSGGTTSTLAASAGQLYSYILLDAGSTFTTSIVQDQAVSAPAGDVSLRVISDTPSTGGLDIYIVPTGSSLLTATPVFSNVLPGTISSYVNLSAATDDIIATSTGTMTVRYTGTGVPFSSGQVRTLIWTDRKYVTPAAVSLTVGDDLN